jgi:phosphoribosyl 1,2-cyclic phosphodiesterase
MKLCVLGSGSSGNCYILQNSKTALILDAGISPKLVLKELGHNSRKIAGVLITHSHDDHTKHIKNYLNLGINCYAHSDTWSELKIKHHFAKNMDEYCENMESIMLGEFLIMPFLLIHDVTCLGYQITHPDSGNIIYITDTKYSPYLFKKVNHWIIECNYSEKQIFDNTLNETINQGLMRRIEDNHMSYETLTYFFGQSDLSQTNKIILVHLSDNNSLEEEFISGIVAMFGKDTYAAKSSLKLNLSIEF